MSEGYCAYCINPERYGLKSAERLEARAHSSSGFAGLMHPPIHPVSEFVGVICHLDPGYLTYDEKTQGKTGGFEKPGA
jgi:hypothetical protein